MIGDEKLFTQRIAIISRRLSDGDLCALGKLYDLSAPRIVRYLDALTRNRQDSEDALQATMIRVAQSPKPVAFADHPWAYLLKMARNEALKTMTRRKPLFSLKKAMAIWTNDEPELERNESQYYVNMALKRLPQEQAEVVVLKIWEEMTFQEIAKVLDESANTAASRYRYALSKLARVLQPLADEVVYEQT